MTDDVNHPQHYTEGFANRPVECIDITRHLPFTLGNAVKYTWRAGKKGDKKAALRDLDKAEWYIEDWRLFREGEDPAGIEAARAVFVLLTEPEGDQLEGARYDLLYALLQAKPEWDIVIFALQRMRGVIQHGQD